MAMAKIKHRVLSVLLTLCMVVVLCAGFLVAAPVEVKAAASVTVTIGPQAVEFNFSEVVYNTNGSVTLSYGTTTHSYNILANSDGGVEALIFFDDFDPVFTPVEGTTYTISYAAGMFLNKADNTPLPSGTFVLPYGKSPTPAPTPAPSSDTPPSGPPERPTDPLEAYHYDLWLPVLTQLNALGNNGTVTIDTAGTDIVYAYLFLWEGLKNTDRTLIIHHGGETYRINGRSIPESMLGHNQLFVGNLDGYRV